MTLAAGTKLGRYEIRAKIGEAGNGRGVFRLRPRIPARVALKVARLCRNN